MFESLDRWLLKRVYQPFSDWFHKNTALNCFFLAHAFLFADVAITSADWWFATSGVHPMRIVWCFMMWLFALGFILLKEEKWNRQNFSNRRPANVLKTMNMIDYNRVMVLEFSTVFFVTTICLSVLLGKMYIMDWLKAVFLFGFKKLVFLSCFYFASCDPPPPRTMTSPDSVPSFV